MTQAEQDEFVRVHLQMIGNNLREEFARGNRVAINYDWQRRIVETTPGPHSRKGFDHSKPMVITITCTGPK